MVDYRVIGGGIGASMEARMYALTLTLNDGTLTHNWTLFEEGEAQESHPLTLARA